jgi:hypothetical protein
MPSNKSTGGKETPIIQLDSSSLIYSPNIEEGQDSWMRKTNSCDSIDECNVSYQSKTFSSVEFE